MVAVTASFLPPALTTIPAASFLLDLARLTPCGSTIDIILSAAACRPTARAKKSLTRPLPTTVSPTCDKLTGRIDMTTTVVTAEVAEDEPALFAAVTTTSTVDPTSARVTVYVDEFAPGIGAQLAPRLSQR